MLLDHPETWTFRVLRVSRLTRSPREIKHCENNHHASPHPMDPVELHTEVEMSYRYFRNGGARGRLAVAGIVTSPYLAEYFSR